ncbi:MAG TPA: M20 family metallo-hydrolase [Chitinophagales bacterium]|nr:M20 family metallo-hydrolase [Chitinophagales bacterium]
MKGPSSVINSLTSAPSSKGGVPVGFLLLDEALSLLKKLISIPSFSREESGTADLIQQFLEQKKIPVNRKLNNIWVKNLAFDFSKPTLLLNSHHDTVRPNSAYTLNPFEPIEKEGKLFGLGSNDAGGCLVSLLSAFLHFYPREDLPFNIIFSATAEEEISGVNGIEAILPLLGEISLAIVGEPTQMNLAIAEKGLLVLDCVAYGKPGHAARDEGDNAIYKAMRDIEWFSTFQFQKKSDTLGTVKMSVTAIKAGTQHNVVPGSCEYVVDIRLNEKYTHEEIIGIVRRHVQSEIKPRSFRIKPSGIPKEHPIVKAAESIGLNTFGSPTASDQALLHFPSVKIGPGDSARSHMADEFIYVDEIRTGIMTYIDLIDSIKEPIA